MAANLESQTIHPIQQVSGRTLSLALARALHIVGEAATRIPREEQKAYPNIRWAEIVGLRNRLVHGYDQVDLDIVWEIATKDIDRLIEELDRIL